MKYPKFIHLLFFSIVSIFIIFGVSSKPTQSSGIAPSLQEQNTDSPDVFLPMIMNNYALPIIPETTNVLTDDSMDHLSSISQDGRTFTFDESTPEIDAIEVGEIIISDRSHLTPSGFLRKVTNVTNTNNQIVITTKAATLEEAIQQGGLQYSRQLKPNEVATSMSLEGVTLQSRAITGIEDSFFIEVKDVVIYDHDGNSATTHDQVKVNGSIEVAPDFDFNLQIRDWELKELAIINTNAQTTELEFESEIEVNLFNKEKELARYYFTPITVFVGIVPIVFEPVLTVNVGVDGDLHVGVTTSVTQEATLTAGLKYENSMWKSVSDFSNSFSFNPPTLSAGLDMKGYAGAQVALLLYGITGPYVEVNAYLKLEADVFATPWWELYGGLEVPVGVKLEIFSHKIASYEKVIIGYKILLAQAEEEMNNPPNIPSSPSPGSPGSVPPGDVILSWNGGDPDGDSVVYDLYVASIPCNIPCSNPPAPNAFDLEASNLTEPVYNNAFASFDWFHYWKIVARDEHGLESIGPIWSYYGNPCLDPSGDYCTVNYPPDMPSNPSPGSPGSVPPGDVMLSWISGDPDGDSVVYDLYIASVPCIQDCWSTPPAEAFSLVASGLGESTYNSTSLFDWMHHWKIVARDEHGLETTGPIWRYYGDPCQDTSGDYCG